MRQIILDTETTGLEAQLGHKLIEIGGVELVNRRFTGNNFHRYLNPERESEAGALEVHGLTSEFLRDKPKFAEIAREFLDYISGAELVIHNSAFDLSFLNRELDLADLKPVTDYCVGIVDTLRMAKEMHPGKRNGLDALCERYQIDNSARTLHGALLDAELLAEVYLAMTRGQETLVMEVETGLASDSGAETAAGEVELFVLRASEEELAQHAQQLEDIDKASKGACLWRALDKA
ncbi:MAG: DNA polymerase III subunit epsilon [Betaproteobacteria bacterium]|nr:MAG: DNA polymerase III subunit epsilon [Betaproteobacteria bacterium SG8_41]UCF77226.1 MAG: DNA polymerase III subunit epsilon [Betaproteobacteria bacterium]